MKKKILFLAPASIPTNGAEHIVNTKLLEAVINISFLLKKIMQENLSS